MFPEMLARNHNLRTKHFSFSITELVMSLFSKWQLHVNSQFKILGLTLTFTISDFAQ